MNRMMMSLVLTAALGLGAQAATVDGFFLNGEYASVISDNSPETQYQGNLDIEKIGFQMQAGFLHIGLAVHEPPVALAGSANTIAGQTIMFTTLYLDELGSVPGFQIAAASDGVNTSLNLMQYVGAVWTPVALTNADFALAFGEAIELKISLDKLAGLPNAFMFATQLDDTGMDADDQISGVAVVPLPAAAWAGLALMGMIGARRVRRGQRSL
jgi:hypothetical protein